MRIEQSNIQKTKVGLHAAQAFCIFVGGCLSLAVLTKDGGTSGTLGFYFGLCFLTIPALVYQVMVPMWTRAWRFANMYAYAIVDLVCAILWFIAFIAVAAWNSSGVRKGDGDKGNSSEENGSCSHFAYGSKIKCLASKASVGFGVIVCLLFVVTTVISVQGVLKYRQTGVMPTVGTKLHGGAERLRSDDATKDPWSTNTDELDPQNEEHDGPFEDERHAYGQTASLGEPHPGRPLGYDSQSNLSVAPPAYDNTAAPSALSPGGYE
ncbi:hypothetical protein BAUCODRAFT_51291, partial [Baudoinia panamericana UAMH 10762]